MSLKPHHVLRVEPPRLLFQGLKTLKYYFFSFNRDRESFELNLFSQKSEEKKIQIICLPLLPDTALSSPPYSRR